mmetsp:Transcript_137122/g.273513  ORF Transcript_137122/g.273513 Transcript_137122/m.273513 type:complete len:511 (-) Transcript_137122:40-1572(-)
MVSADAGAVSQVESGLERDRRKSRHTQVGDFSTAKTSPSFFLPNAMLRPVSVPCLHESSLKRYATRFGSRDEIQRCAQQVHHGAATKESNAVHEIPVWGTGVAVEEGGKALVTQRSAPQLGSKRERNLSDCMGGPLTLISAGASGVEELRKHFSNTSVSWALHRFQVGSGTFLRTKLLAIHINGQAMPPMRRGMLNARGGEVLSAFGEVHVTLEVTKADELTPESLCKRVLPFFSVDHGQLSFHTLLQEYCQAMPAQYQEAVAWKPEQTSLSPEEAGKKRLRQTLQAVGAKCGRYNWALIQPATLNLHAAGSGGIDEMLEALSDNKVLFGVLRLSFGSSGTSPIPSRDCKATIKQRLTKHVLVHWMGSHVSGVKRGLLNSRTADAANEVSRHCHTVMRVQAQQRSDLCLEDLLHKLRSRTSMDLIVNRLSPEDYFAGLREELLERRSKHSLEIPLRAAADIPANQLQAAVATVRETSGKWNWMLCGWPSVAPATIPKTLCESPCAVLGGC